jgi:hypothetical protein
MQCNKCELDTTPIINGFCADCYKVLYKGIGFYEERNFNDNRGEINRDIPRKWKVGGMVEIVPLPNGQIMILNEEGKLDGLPINELGTEFWKLQYPIEQYPNNNDELVVGDIIVCDSELVN